MRSSSCDRLDSYSRALRHAYPALGYLADCHRLAQRRSLMAGIVPAAQCGRLRMPPLTTTRTRATHAPFVDSPGAHRSAAVSPSAEPSVPHSAAGLGLRLCHDG